MRCASAKELLADGEETPDDVPREVGVVPVQAQVAPGAVPGEEGHAAAPVRAHPEGAEGHDRELSLDIGVLGPERQEVFDLRRLEAEPVEMLGDFLGGGVAVEVDEVKFDILLRATALDREMLDGDVVVLPVVVTGLDHVDERLVVVHRDGERFERLSRRLVHGRSPFNVMCVCVLKPF